MKSSVFFCINHSGTVDIFPTCYMSADSQTCKSWTADSAGKIGLTESCIINDRVGH